MLDKYVWRVLFLALLATASLATPSLTSPGPSCHDDVYERTRLRKLRLESGQESPVAFADDTTYEQLVCIGFNPVLNLLSATIKVKLPYGFNGGLCTNGPFEYVRFWVNYDNGLGWTEIGTTRVNTHDILDSLDCCKFPTKPLYYTLSINFEPDHKQCETPVLPRIRATLSWNSVPSNWGNTLEATIQSLSATSNSVATVVYTGLDSNSPIDHMDFPDSVGEGYSDRCIPGQEVLSTSQTEVAEVQLDAGPNVVFEELTCLGLDWGQSSLVATVHIKQRRGYLATPCQNHSFEYVSFWADWNDTCSWVYLGTTKFNVHNFFTAPSTGLMYTAVLPVDVTKFSAPCNKTKIARVRAALAFNQIPPQPPILPIRGNYIETHVHLQPYNLEINPTIPRIRLIGNVPLQEIQTTPNGPISGMTIEKAFIVGHGFADPSGDNSRPCPFGGTIIIRGEPFVGHSYRLMVRPYPPPPLNPDYPGLAVLDYIEVTDLTHPHPGIPVRIYPSPEGYFNYLAPLNNFENVLSWWTPKQGSWQIRLEMAQFSQMTGKYSHEGYSPWYMVLVNQRDPPPYAYLDINGTECNDIRINDKMSGNFVATSAYLDSWGFDIAPGGIPQTVTVEGGADPLMPVSKPGKTWNLATNQARACGYVIWLTVRDRTVVDSGGARYSDSMVKGFCLHQ